MARDVTITFEDGQSHTYQNAPDDITPEMVQSRAEKEFGKKVTSLDGGRQSQSQVQQDKPWYDSTAEFLTGKGVPKDADLTDRAWHALEAGVGNAAVLGGAGLITGVGALPMAGIGFGGGVLSDIAEQIAAIKGAGRGLQLATGVAGGGLAPLVEKSIGSLGRFAANKFLGYGGNQLQRDILSMSGVENDSNIRQQLQNARSAMMEGRSPLEANTELGNLFTGADEASANMMKQAVSARQSAMDSAKAAIQRQVEEDIAKKSASTAAYNSGLQQQQFAAEQARNAAQRELQATQEAGIGTADSLYHIGDKLRTKVIGRFVPALEKAKADYESALIPVMQAADTAEASGNFWAASPEAQAIKDKWLKDLPNHADDSVKGVESIIKQIWGTKTVSKEVVDEAASAQAGTPVMKTVNVEVPDFASARKIDEIIRQLGEAYNKDSSGFGAIDPILRKKLRKELTHGLDEKNPNGFYEWSGLGQAKENYKAALDAQAEINNKLGDTLVAKDADRKTFINDPAKALTDALSSADSLNKFVALVGPQDAADTISQYAISTIKGKDAAAARNWLDTHAHLNDPRVGGGAGKAAYNAVENYARQLAGHESTINKANTTIESIKPQIKEATSGLEAFKKTALAEAESKLSSETKASEADIKSIQDKLETTGLFNMGKGKLATPSTLGERLWSTDLTDSNITQIGNALKGNPGMQSRVFDSAAHMLSKTSPADLQYSLGRVEGLLKGMGVTDDAALSQLRQQVQTIQESAKKMKVDPTAEYVKLFKRVVISAAGTPLVTQNTPRLFDSFRKENKK